MAFDCELELYFQLNGCRLADEALKRRRDLKVLFTTGYTRNSVVQNGLLDAGGETAENQPRWSSSPRR